MTWHFNESAKKRLSALANIASPSTDETRMASFLRQSWTSAGAVITTDVMGNIHAVINEGHPIHIGLAAHMDTIACQTTEILPNGIIRFRTLGASPIVLLGQKVLVLTEHGDLDGVVGYDPLSQFRNPENITSRDLWIDTFGSRSKAGDKAEISVGDLVVILPQITIPEGNELISGCGLDDKIGLFVMDECLRYFSEHKISACLHLFGTVQEEIATRGAAVATSARHLDACFVIDVDYAMDTAVSHQNDMGFLALGKGAGLHKKADNNPVLFRLARQVAEHHKLPYQISLGRHISGCTDASAIQLSNKGVATLNLNIPCRYMHSAIEICSLKDVKATIELLIKIIEYIAAESKNSFIPGID